MSWGCFAVRIFQQDRGFHMYRILVVYDERQDWHDLGEGPWESSRSALHFAETEVGVPWIVVDDSNRPVAFGDSSKVVWSRLRSPQGFRHEAPTSSLS